MFSICTGCLMLLAWMVSTSIAIILARYYKLMWPNDRWCGQKIWFAVRTLLFFFITVMITGRTLQLLRFTDLKGP